ncbi:MAG: hypothetical protein IKB06_02040 [Clostridia bacterium]|nr:hypothetical protein [Clostridia bacterium]
MEKLTEKYKKDYMYEINNHHVEVEELKKLGVSEKTLASEIFLRKIYGDEILMNEVPDDLDSKSKRKVQKVDLTEMEGTKGLKAIDDDIELSEFDKNFETIVKK